jgi:hypothetical protein
MTEDQINGGEDRRPMPARAAMETTDSESESEERVPPLRRFRANPKEEWVVRVSGRSTSGVLPLRVIPLMELSFARAEAPEASLRRAICQGESLEEVDDAALLDLLDSSEAIESRGTEKGGVSRRDRRTPVRKGTRR